MIREPGTGENRSSSTASQPGTTATILSLFGFWLSFSSSPPRAAR